jgi:hypothetical protein
MCTLSSTGRFFFQPKQGDLNMTASEMARRSACFVAALCGLLLLGSTVIAGDFVPLKGKFEGVGPDFSGNFTHLGKFAGVFNVEESTAVWTAANGDTVTTQTILFEPIEEVELGVFIYEQSLVITGGTGRFANAEGFADVVGLIDFVTFEFDGDLVGEISRPNSRR